MLLTYVVTVGLDMRSLAPTLWLVQPFRPVTGGLVARVPAVGGGGLLTRASSNSCHGRLLIDRSNSHMQRDSGGHGGRVALNPDVRRDSPER